MPELQLSHLLADLTHLKTLVLSPPYHPPLSARLAANSLLSRPGKHSSSSLAHPRTRPRCRSQKMIQTPSSRAPTSSFGCAGRKLDAASSRRRELRLRGR